MHHIDIHVRDISAAKRLFDAIGPHIGLELRNEFPDFVSYWRGGKRPSAGFILDEGAGSGHLRVAFAARDEATIDAVAAAAKRAGARNVEGPSIHSEYSDDYYAVFFEDAEGNKFEVVRDPDRMIARIWRGRVHAGMLDEYREYISETGLHEYTQTPGNRGAYMLTRELPTHGEVLTVSFWDSYDAIELFAGKPVDRAKYYPEDKRFLLDFPENVEHYDVLSGVHL